MSENEESDFYEIQVICENCSWKGTIEIPKGKKFESHDQNCPFCKCGNVLARRFPSVLSTGVMINRN